MTQLPNILIVDDKKENLIFLESFIKKMNVCLIQALSGSEALQKTQGIEIALAIIDVNMPGMNGDELAMKMNEQRLSNKVPVIFLTANYINEKEVIKGYNSGAVDYIFKPVEIHILISKINVFLDLFIQKQIIISNALLLNESAKELKRINGKIKKSEEKYRFLTENISDVIWIYNFTKGNYTYISPSVYQLRGFTETEALTKDIKDSLTPESGQKVMETIAFRAKEFKNALEKTYIDQVEQVCKDGSVKWVEIVSEFQYANDGSIEIQGVSRDISDRKYTEVALQESKSRLSKTQNIAHLGSWELDIQTDKLIWSDEVYNIFGLNPEEFTVTNESFLDSVHPDDRNSVRLTFYNSIKQNKDNYEIEHRIIRKNTGEIRYVSEKSEHIRDFSGKIIRTLGMVQDITERKHSEEALRKFEEKFSLAMDATSDGLWDWDIITGNVYYSPGYFRILGYNTNEFGNNFNVWEKLTHPDDLKLAMAYIDSCINNVIDIIKVEFRMKTKDGNWKWILSRGKAVRRDKNGKALRLIGTHMDISERKKVENDLKESEYKYRELVENSPNAITIYAENKIVFVNNECLKLMSATSKEELIGKSVLQFVHPENRSLVLKRMEKAANGNTPLSLIEEKFLRLDGSEVDVEVKALPIRLGNKPAVQLIISDITERKKAENELLQLNEKLEERVKERTVELLKLNTALQLSEKKYRTVANYTYDWEFWLDENENMIYSSPSCERITGYKASEFIQNPKLFYDIIHPDDLSFYLIHKSNESTVQNASNEINYRIIRFDGTIRWIGHECQPIFDETGSFKGIRGGNRDITVKKEIEQQLKKSEQKYRLVSENITDGIFKYKNGYFEYVNSAMNSIFGYESQELDGVMFSKIVKTDYQDELKSFLNLDTSLNQNLSLELECSKKDFSTVFVEILFNFVANEKAIYGVVHDITERKHNHDNIVKAIVLTEEKERAYFSKELHDGLGPLLSTIKLYLQWSERPNSSITQIEAVHMAEEILEDALITVKEISNKLSPHLLTYYGLSAAIQSYIDKQENSSTVKIDFQYNSSNRFDKDIEVAIYRAIIECINNTNKHAKAKNILINLKDSGNSIKIQYRDDGCGFDVPKTLSLQKGLGLYNLQTRIKNIGGKIKMASKPGMGVNYQINLVL